MASQLADRMDEIVWDQGKDVFGAVHALTLDEMQYKIYPCSLWKLREYAMDKEREHHLLQSGIENIQAKMKSHAAGDDHLSLDSLVSHHRKLAKRYGQAAYACSD